MKTIYLMRHADATPAAPMADDHGRQLSPLGLQQAKQTSAYLENRSSPPTAILASDAIRTLMTAEIVADGWFSGKIQPVSALYDAVVDTLLSEIAKVDDNVQHLMIVAHNPGIAELALWLSRGSDAVYAFPPATLVEFSCDIEYWHEINEKNCHVQNVNRC